MSEAAAAIIEFRTSVRELVEFVYRTGNLGGEGGFQAANRGVEGTKGHRRVQRSRGYAYVAEVPVERVFERPGIVFRLNGRVDGLMPDATPPVVEEIKTFDRGWDGLADPVHLAQLRVYAALLAEARGWPEVNLWLTYLDLNTGVESVIRERESAESLGAFLARTVDEWFGWLSQQADWRRQRDASLEALVFPFPDFRAGQRALSGAVYRTIRDGGRLFAEAPTGLGKTMATLFPAAKAIPLLGEGQVFYVTAKTPGRHAAEAAIDRLRDAGAGLRSLTLTAKRKLCFTESPTGCDLRVCPFAVGYYDRIKPAVQELLAKERLDRPAIEATARAHQVCPFELSLDASLWTDLVIGDFNYVFDPSARLQRHFAEGSKRHVVLVDEAHNLVDRSREMYSARLAKSDLDLRRGAVSGKGVRGAQRALSEAQHALDRCLGVEAPSLLPVRPHHDGAVALADAPTELMDALAESAGAIEAFLVQQPPGADLSAWLEPWFAIQSFLRVAEAFDSTCRTILDRDAERVTVFCVDPARRLHDTVAELRAAVFFSATLSPVEYFRELLGGGSDDRSVVFPSPFDPEQMQISVLSHDVTYKGRSTSLPAVALAVAAHVREREGNHLVYAPSLAYLATLEASLEALGVEVFSQTSSMDELARDEFLARFAVAGRGVGLAVLGGIFAEGIDLPGDRLVGVSVIGVGLPGLSLERDLLAAHFEQTRQAGFDYAYRFPGMQRVFQAVGRLIRTETDRGHALLVDRRFREGRYRKLFPSWWQVSSSKIGIDANISP